jgi:hypothetical protein
LKKSLKRELRMENLKKTTMKMAFTNHNGCIPQGERVIIISIDNELGEVKLADPFDRIWDVPKTYVNLD